MSKQDVDYIYIKTQELGEAIRASEIYRNMRESEARARENPQPCIIDEMNDSTREFASLIRQVNQVLQFIITGEMDEKGCGGACAECAGCAAREG